LLLPKLIAVRSMEAGSMLGGGAVVEPGTELEGVVASGSLSVGTVAGGSLVVGSVASGSPGTVGAPKTIWSDRSAVTGSSFAHATSTSGVMIASAHRALVRMAWTLG
jgi:hypothetical protein